MAKKKANYYAVRKGSKTGIFLSWHECEASVSGYPGAQFKGFQTREEAEIYLKTGDVLNPVKFYGIARGRVPGVYSSWPKAQEQISSFPGARFRGFGSIQDAKIWVASMSLDPDPSKVFVAQSHFDQFKAPDNEASATTFQPTENKPFLDEFAMLASSQNWVPGTQEYREHRNEAIKEEFEFHYLTPLAGVKVEDEAKVDPEELNRRKMECYRALCAVLGKAEPSSIPEARTTLKSMPWVNIIHLIDARRLGASPRTWYDFEEFKNYTVAEEKWFNLREAKEDEFLSTLLVDFERTARRLAHKRKSADSTRSNSRVQSGRVSKRKTALVTSSTANTRKIVGILQTEPLDPPVML